MDYRQEQIISLERWAAGIRRDGGRQAGGGCIRARLD
jgi:hypothetical protein